MTKRWQTPEAAELAQSAGVDDPAEAMRRHARALLDECGAGGVPVRLSALFTWAGVRKVRSEDMPLEGALRRLPDGRFDIIVREDAPMTRQRFSTAHELGHLIFHRHAPRAKAMQAQRGTRAPQEEEWLCNVAAEELLMPLAAVQQACAQSADAERALHLVQLCDVSPEAALIRLAPLWVGRGELQLLEHRAGSGWTSKLARRLGHSRLSLKDFEVDGWNGAVPESSALPWRATTRLYDRRRRVCLVARTSVIAISRRLPTVLISHELVQESALDGMTDLERAGRARVRRAETATPVPGCPICRGTGWNDEDTGAFDPAKRMRPVRICQCRYDQGQRLSA